MHPRSKMKQPFHPSSQSPGTPGGEYGVLSIIMDGIICFAEKYRIIISKLFAILLFVLVVFTSHSWQGNTLVDLTVEVSGFFLIVICTLGRLWASMYIAGNKTHKLITEGPYRMVRNPLYFFSFLGALGIGLSSENLLAFLIIVTLFSVYYPLVILAEEKRMIAIHKEKYLEYMRNTPRFFPKLSLLQEPDSIMVHVRPYRRVFFRVMWFMWVFMILQVIEKLQNMGLLPVLSRIP